LPGMVWQGQGAVLEVRVKQEQESKVGEPDLEVSELRRVQEKPKLALLGMVKQGQGAVLEVRVEQEQESKVGEQDLEVLDTLDMFLGALMAVY
jgi:hypothetical protein